MSTDTLVWLLIWTLTGSPHTIGVYPDLGMCLEKLESVKLTHPEADVRCYPHRDTVRKI